MTGPLTVLVQIQLNVISDHSLSTHGNFGDDLTCPSCGKMFYNSTSLKWHKDTDHKSGTGKKQAMTSLQGMAGFKAAASMVVEVSRSSAG